MSRGAIRRTACAAGTACLTVLLASGCVVVDQDREGFGSRATGTRGIEIDTPPPVEALLLGERATTASLEAPWPALELGEGEPLPFSARPEPMRAGETYLVSIATGVGVTLRGAVRDDVGLETRTIGEVQGRLLVRTVDDAGRIQRATFEVVRASLERDGGVLAAVPAGRTVSLERRGGRLVVRLGNGEMAGDMRRLFEQGLLMPLESPDFSAGVQGRAERRLGETWDLRPEVVARLLGLSQDMAAGERGIGRRVRLPTDGGRGPALDAVEFRLQADSAGDERILNAFGESLTGLPAVGAIVRVADARAGARGITFFLAQRFDLEDAAGPMRGERLERLELSITPER